MSRKTQIMCDVCGKEIAERSMKEDAAVLRMWPPGAYRAGPGQRIDICEECYNKLVRFLESGGT